MLPEETTVLLALPPSETTIRPSVLMTAAFAVPPSETCSPAEMTVASFAVPFSLTRIAPPLETLNSFALPPSNTITWPSALTVPDAAMPLTYILPSVTVVLVTVVFSPISRYAPAPVMEVLSAVPPE